MTPGSGNVFADLGLPDPELRLAKADLSRAMWQRIMQLGLTCESAAETTGLARGELSAVLRGRLSDFSMERLQAALTALEELL